LASVKDAIDRARGKLSGAKPTLAILFVSPMVDLRSTLGQAKELLPETECIGCTTAGEITEEGLAHGGVSVLLVAGEMKVEPLLALDVSRNTIGAAKKLAYQFESRRVRALEDGFGAATSILLVDGINGQGEALVDELMRTTGSLHEVVGGAAADEGAFQGTEVGHGRLTSKDAAVALRVFSRHRWGIGVDHGLSPISPEMQVTRADGTTVYELDEHPAFDVYREFARDRGVYLDPRNAGAFLINHELGVYLFGQLKKARAPLKVTSDGALSCAAPVPRGAWVRIMGGDARSLAAAAGRAAREAKERLGGRRAAGVLLFDCICRGTIMGRDFDKELTAVKDVFPNVPIGGFLTYGEIARYSGRLDGWHNTTAVVVAIPG
jgi:hypothetical protein